LLKEKFTAAAFFRKRVFAEEIRRIGKRYFVQTPYKYFPIETHTWLPAFILLLPRGILIRLIQFNNKWWIKKTIPDFNLMTRKMMKELFPDAEIIPEKLFGFTKSLIAIKR
jgi:hypothetical protein